MIERKLSTKRYLVIKLTVDHCTFCWTVHGNSILGSHRPWTPGFYFERISDSKCVIWNQKTL